VFDTAYSFNGASPWKSDSRSSLAHPYVTSGKLVNESLDETNCVASVKLHDPKAVHGPYVLLESVWGSCSEQGRRPAMEDTWKAIPSFFTLSSASFTSEHSLPLRGTGHLGYYAVFDGHCGSRCAEYAKANLHQLIIKALSNSTMSCRNRVNMSRVFKEAFMELDNNYSRNYYLSNDGSTALVCIIETYFHQEGSSASLLNIVEGTEEHQRLVPLVSRLHVAHVGDCRAVLGRSVTETSSCSGDCESVRLSEDHKPNRPDEQARIQSSGGIVQYSGCFRVGVADCSLFLAVSRAFGDFTIKRLNRNILIPVPEYQQRDLRPFEDQFVVIASDGLWDKMSDDQVVSLVSKELSALESVASPVPPPTKSMMDGVCKTLVQEAIRRGSEDNVTVVIVRLIWNIVFSS